MLSHRSATTIDPAVEKAEGSSLEVRVAEAADWPSIAALHVASWRSAYRGIYSDRFLDEQVDEDRRAYWQRELPLMSGEEDIVLLAADKGGMPVGFACIRRRSDPAGPLLDNLHVLPARKGEGVGQKLLGAAARWLAEKEAEASLQLFVWEANGPARGFYRRLGAEEVERFEEATPGGGVAPIIRMRWAKASDLARSG